MPILVVGVSHRGASLDLLERLAFTGERLPKAYRRLTEAEEVNGAVVLSTCNRVEVYGEVASYHSGFLALKRFLAEATEVPAEEIAEPLFSHYEDDASEHLFRVAAGLDSMVLGEPQILTQVRQAFRRAEREAAAGTAISALFRAAIRAGRRVRSETGVGASPAAFVRAGLDEAGRVLGPLAGRTAVVIGAGQMAALAVDALRDAGAGPIRVVNRTPERASPLAARAGAAGAHGLDDLSAALAGAEIAVCCTGAAGVVVGADAVRSALAGRGGGMPAGMLFLIDLAVPRDVDPAVKRLPGVRVVDIDDLRERFREEGGPGDLDLDRAREIVVEEVHRLAARRRAARLAPLIGALRESGERAAAAELARAAARLSRLQPAERKAVEALARGIVAKLLHEPIVRVKEMTGPGRGNDAARTLAELFGIEFSSDD